MSQAEAFDDKHRHARLSWFLMAIGIGLLAIAAILWRSTTDELAIPSTSVSLGEIEGQERYPASFVLHNVSQRPILIVGAQLACDEQGCGHPPESLPLTIPPGTTQELKIDFSPRRAGPFEYRFEIFTDAPRQSRIPLSIRGTLRGT